MTLQLLWRFWPQLMVLWLIGRILDSVLLELAVQIGLVNALAGLSTLALVVLMKLVIIVAFFQTIRPGLPALNGASQVVAARPEEEVKSSSFSSALALTLVPFFAYYAAWGFLGDTIRDYSKLSLDLMMFGEKIAPLEVRGGAWLVISVAIAWLVRLLAKRMHKRFKSAVWPIVIVICEANWAFIGLFVISNWQDDVCA
ncbi:hypothetical protein [Rhizobium sp. RCC_161_2]|uniref:hypothetical protein n=1 Tax=Rhizobium sp. RCC_161_2 TaxID=3239219 RepID=UPI003526A118